MNRRDLLKSLCVVPLAGLGLKLSAPKYEVVNEPGWASIGCSVYYVLRRDREYCAGRMIKDGISRERLAIHLQYLAREVERLNGLTNPLQCSHCFVTECVIGVSHAG